MSLFTELQRRNVFRVGIAYVITAWLVAQVLELVFDSFGAPDWAMKAVLATLAAGLPLVLVFAWIFELTPEGLKRDAEVDRSRSAAPQTGRKLDRAIIVVLVLALAYFVWESRFAGEQATESPPTSTASSEPQSDRAIGKSETAGGKTVAVLPFLNMSPNPEQEYFSDGITEEVINALVKIPGLSVPARTSVFAYKGRLEDVRQIGRELDVAHVLEGSIRSQGKQVRITAQLINVESGYHLWSETFDRQLENIFAVQEEIAASIAEVLVGELGVEVAAVPNQTRNMEAYDLYLQGRAALRNREETAIALFQAVTERDPGFAPGWAALAMAHNSIGDDDAAAIDAAERALSMDPDNVDALNAMGATMRELNRWAEAERFLDRALAIDPSSAELLEDYAEFLNFVGRTDEALEVTTRAMAVEPGLMPLQQEHMAALLASGRGEEARKVASGLAQATGERGWSRRLLGWTVERVMDPDHEPTDRRPPEIDANEAQLPPMADDFVNLLKADDLLTTEWGQRLRALIDSISSEEGAGYIYWMSRVPLVRAGQADFVFETDNLLQRISFEWTWVPAMKPFRQHHRFAEFLESAGLVAYWDATEWPKWCRRNENGMITCQ